MTSPLRVLIDGRMLLGRFSGVARVVTRLVENLVNLPEIQVVVLCGNEPYRPWVGRHDIEMMVSDFSRRDRSPVRRCFWEATQLWKWIDRTKADVFHATWNTGVPIRSPVPAVLTVHDVIPWNEPCRGLTARLAQVAYRHGLRASVAHALRVTVVSGFTALELSRRVRIDPERIRVIYNGVDAPTNAKSEPREQCLFMLYVGGHEPRKNLEAVFGALARYWSDYDPAMELHLTGSADQLTPVARTAYEQLKWKDRVRFLGSLSDVELAREYRGATALLLLSWAEGFGLPILEAMSHGCPVIAANRGCLPEIVGNAGVLVDPDDVQSIALCINNIITSPEETDSLINRGLERAAQFSWRRAAESYVRDYQSALSPLSETPKLTTGTRLACMS